ncbi:MAG: regulatory protein RecX [Treponema sp.]|nr:regulatory protein RecX [Treponema sp.]
MKIRSVEQTLPGVYKIVPEAGSVFFLRATYLNLVDEKSIVPCPACIGSDDMLFTSTGDESELEAGPGVFSDEEWEDILHAALVFSAERAAMSYLGRAEHCRSGLFRKITAKGIDKEAVNLALDYLEQEGLLDDRRFADAWLSTRYVDHAEGRRKLSAELAARGVKRQAAEDALSDFFSRYNEKDICFRALKKYLRTHASTDENKLTAHLSRLGFSSSQIKQARKNLEEEE